MHDVDSGRLLHVFSNGLASRAMVLNDLVPTPTGDLDVTDSLTPTLWRIPAGAIGGPQRAALVVNGQLDGPRR